MENKELFGRDITIGNLVLSTFYINEIRYGIITKIC